MASNERPFLGTGWSFPPTFENNGASLELVSGVENVHKSIRIILGTSVGERVFRETFGASLERYQFEPLTQQLVNDIEEVITDAILLNEPRVDLEAVSIDEDRSQEGLLLIQLSYVVRSTNSRFNMVYPFFLNEAESNS